MPAIPCYDSIQCECPELPLENLSSEDADVPLFCSTVTFHADPRLGDCVGEFECTKFCCSEESQQDAYFCALREAQDCVYSNWTVTDCPLPACDPDCPTDCPPFCDIGCPPYCPPVPPPPGIPIYVNSPQACAVICPDGSAFTSTVRGGIIQALSQSEADFLAHAVACRNAQLQKICFSTAALLPSACLSEGETYYKELKASGGTPIVVTFAEYFLLPQECRDAGVTLGNVFPYFWTIVAGSLPAGLRLGACDGIIAGTPTESGDFTFTVRITDATGSYTTKTFYLSIIAFSDATDLPDGTVGNAYSHTIDVTGGATPITWSLEAGALPDGLSLNTATGAITGTPTTQETRTFTILVEDGS